MTSAEFESILPRLVREYAAENVAVGNWTPEEAEDRASRQTEQLLPQGVDSPGVLWLMAETSTGEAVGFVWLALERQPGAASGAWIYDIEILPDFRGQGLGRAHLAAAESAAAEHGIESIGLNVSGRNTVARSLYESAGYRVTTLQLSKELLHESSDGIP
jgi:ribosomal protein S18 acetylase RimI-like enzyme